MLRIETVRYTIHEAEGLNATLGMLCHCNLYLFTNKKATTLNL